ncbi:PepSY domain-containing protein [Planotetraspora mira]|uniref:PepSY domain-containing protein n=1 Tax=Planotetraspora mira TaxID=58121 RepID=A0A8J3TJJ3_9ACTN|nr:PepSY domain-containing protein [Planotetraspora mira]GII28223.1 hypothetical protein Pmi06nite_16650 [Planotetraspora mira]
MTNTPRISKTAKLALAATGSVALIGLVATSTFAAASPGAPSAMENTGTPSPSDGTSTGPADTTPTDAAAAPTPTPETATATPAGITSRQAIEIAGARVPGARVTGVERELEHGHRVWEVKLVKGGIEYDVQVSADSGTVVRLRQDRGDDGVRAARGLGDDPARHDVDDDHGRRGGGNDDHGSHEAGDDHGRHGHGNDDRGLDDHGNDRHGA